MKKITNFFIRLVEKYMPDPFIYAIVLTILTFVLGLIFNNDTPLGMAYHWIDGFWSFLGFGMQMVLVIVFGTVIAVSPTVDKLLKRLCNIPKNPKQAVAFTVCISTIGQMLNWGFGIVVGAVISREVAKKVRGVDFRLLLATCYATSILSVPNNSIILKVAGDVNELTNATNGVLTEILPLSKTFGNPYFLVIFAAMFLCLLFVSVKIHPSPEDTVSIDPSLFGDDDIIVDNSKGTTPAEKMERFTPFSIIVVLIALAGIFRHFVLQGKGMDLNIMNFLMMTIGMILHKTPIRFADACSKAVQGASGVILQFPFYAGIMGMMLGANAEGVNLARVVAGSLVDVASVNTLPIIAFFTAAILNFFVPSSGGLWGVQAPFMFPAAQALGVDYPLMIMAIVLGETVTNLVQPFWAMPMLGIAGMKVRDIMGFCTIMMIALSVVIIPLLLIWSFIA